jgi:hypothetical protein
LTLSNRITIVKNIEKAAVEQNAYGGTMKAVAFRGKVNPDGTILLPKKLRQSVKGDEVRVILLWPESVDDASLWEQESIEAFIRGDGLRCPLRYRWGDVVLVAFPLSDMSVAIRL